MEKELDIIAKGDSVWHRLCNKCNEQIETESEPFKTDIDKFSYDFDDKHSLIIGKYGPVIKKTLGKEVKFIKVIEDLDLDKVREGIYKMEDILYNKKSEKILGKYKNEYLTIKNGKYGLYATWGSNHTSLKDLDKPIDEITIEDVKKVIDNAKKSPILRYNDELSLRTGQYGPYIFYKTEKMKKPKFYNVRLSTDEDIKDTLYMKMTYDKFITWFKKSGDSPFNN
jgi:DNA topoisomerase-1